MADDRTRIDALRQGLTHSHDAGFVAIRVADLRWLLDQVELRDSEPSEHDDFEGGLDEPEHD